MNILSIDRVLEFCIVYLLEHSNILSAARVVEFYISHLLGRASVGKVFFSSCFKYAVYTCLLSLFLLVCFSV